MNAPRRKTLVAVLAGLLLITLATWLAVSRFTRPGKTMRLPGQAVELAGLAAQSRDAMDLSRRLRKLGYATIIVDGPSGRTPADWNPGASKAGAKLAPLASDASKAGVAQTGRPKVAMFAPASSEKLIQFWRLFTQPEERSSGNTVVYRLTAEPARRMISLAEPPVLVELARDGEALERAGQTRAALAAFQRARMKAPGLPVLAYGIARCYRSLGEPLKAEKELRRAITMAGPDPILYEALGEILEALKDPRLAALAFEQAAGLDGSSARRWIRAARALKAAGNAPAAAAALSRALAIEPGNPQARALQGKIRS